MTHDDKKSEPQIQFLINHSHEQDEELSKTEIYDFDAQCALQRTNIAKLLNKPKHFILYGMSKLLKSMPKENEFDFAKRADMIENLAELASYECEQLLRVNSILLKLYGDTPEDLQVANDTDVFLRKLDFQRKQEKSDAY